ncbi:MAG: hypothetical protein IJD85_05055 [Oscillospiraceae bacterium]|nr:hypothetical protein [Oscillospiraceae bacterium]
MRFSEKCRLVFCVLHIPTMKKGMKLGFEAHTAEEIAAAKAFKRVFTGVIIITVLYVVGLVAMFLCNIPFLDSGTRRNGTVQQNGSVKYVQNTEKFVSQESLGLSEVELSEGDKIIIFFDKDDNINSAYPKAYYDSYTETRVFAILGYALIGITVILIYALIICRLTPFGSAWCEYLRKNSENTQELPLRRRVIINIVSVAVAVLICMPQLIGIIENARRMEEINEFGKTIKQAQQAADYAERVTENLEGLDEKLDSNSGLDNANEASDRIHDIMAGLKKDE